MSTSFFVLQMGHIYEKKKKKTILTSHAHGTYNAAYTKTIMTISNLLWYVNNNCWLILMV